MKLREERMKLREERMRLWEERMKLWEERMKLWEERMKLREEKNQANEGDYSQNCVKRRSTSAVQNKQSTNKTTTSAIIRPIHCIRVLSLIKQQDSTPLPSYLCSFRATNNCNSITAEEKKGRQEYAQDFFP